MGEISILPTWGNTFIAISAYIPRQLSIKRNWIFKLLRLGCQFLPKTTKEKACELRQSSMTSEMPSWTGILLFLSRVLTWFEAVPTKYWFFMQPLEIIIGNLKKQLRDTAHLKTLEQQTNNRYWNTYHLLNAPPTVVSSKK